MKKELENINQQQSTEKKAKNDSTWKRLLRLCILLAILNYFFSLSIVPSDSMSPTIEPKDFIVYQKKFNEIKRGDIVGFQDPYGDEIFIKRVVALGGETIEIEDGKVYLNGKVLEEPYLKEEMLGDMEATVIPENELFVMGDNRNSSADSRVFGTIKESEIKGKFIAIILPFNRFTIYKNEGIDS